MTILLDDATRVLVQATSGRIGSFHAADMIRNGPNAVTGVTPGRGSSRILGRPVFDTVKQAVAATAAEASIVFVPPPFAAGATMEAAAAGPRFCVCITDGIPAQDMMRVKRCLRRYRAEGRMRLIGPHRCAACARCRIGPVRLLSRSERAARDFADPRISGPWPARSSR